MLEKGRRHTRKCQLWAHAVDDRPWQGPAPPAVAYFYQWWTYALQAPPNPVVTLWLKIGAGVASTFVAMFTLAILLRGRTIGPSLRPRLLGGSQRLIRGVTDNHGHADWLPIGSAQEMFPGPSPAFGGIVVGEAYRVDRDSVAKLRFDPHDKASWGRGGKAPLLIDPCNAGPTHSLVFAGTGSFKSTCAVSTLLTWTGSAVVLDPSGELGPMLAKARAAMGHDVHQLDLRGGIGFNVLDWIAIASPLAATNVSPRSGIPFAIRHCTSVSNCCRTDSVQPNAASVEQPWLATWQSRLHPAEYSLYPADKVPIPGTSGGSLTTVKRPSVRCMTFKC